MWRINTTVTFIAVKCRKLSHRLPFFQTNKNCFWAKKRHSSPQKPFASFTNVDGVIRFCPRSGRVRYHITRTVSSFRFPEKKYEYRKRLLSEKLQGAPSKILLLPWAGNCWVASSSLLVVVIVFRITSVAVESYDMLLLLSAVEVGRWRGGWVGTALGTAAQHSTRSRARARRSMNRV